MKYLHPGKGGTRQKWPKTRGGLTSHTTSPTSKNHGYLIPLPIKRMLALLRSRYHTGVEAFTLVFHFTGHSLSTCLPKVHEQPKAHTLQRVPPSATNLHILSLSWDASPSSHRCTYDAFLSFRGPDTRKGFTDHLYWALEKAGIHTFRDDDEIERGANISEELQKAIQESRVSIIVFSKDYASSRWCLDELVTIMDRRETNEHMVMPIFYDVDPSHVRNQTGIFEEAFARHQQRFNKEMDKVEKWRKALRDVADLGGMVLGDRDVGVAVVYGMGGIGKTTIAKTAYNQNFYKFQGSSFLADIRATSELPNGLVHLQRNLLSDLQKEKAKEIYSLDEGIREINRAICCKRVLIALDDVDKLDQFNALIEMREWLHPGSKIIITTRHEHLLKAHENCAMFKVKGLDEYESLELFSWHAFRQPHPGEGYMDLSRPVVQHCGGVPLALKVLGSSLFGKAADVWKNALQNLDVITEGKIEKILRISFDSLQDHDKRLFLHIACFFIGKDKDFSSTVLDECEFATNIGIQNLVDRCLLIIDRFNKLTMHQLLQDMGKGIIREESPEDPGKRTRVWNKDASNVLRKLTVRNMFFYVYLLTQCSYFLPNVFVILKDCINLKEVDESIGDLEKLVFLNLKDCKNLMKLPIRISMLRSLQELILSGCSNRVLPASMIVKNQSDSTPSDMKKLSLWQSMQSWVLPRKNPQLTSASLPQFLKRLHMAYCNLSEIPNDLSSLSSLQYLDLSGNPFLSLPVNMNGLSKLQTLLLEWCPNLEMIPELPPSVKFFSADRFEIQNVFKKRPLRSVDIEMIKDIGLFNLESIGSTKVKMENHLNVTVKEGPLQGLDECGIFSIFLPGREVPDWFCYKSSMG
ncbi:unnamed protein product [Prunus brigantina]